MAQMWNTPSGYPPPPVMPMMPGQPYPPQFPPYSQQAVQPFLPMPIPRSTPGASRQVSAPAASMQAPVTSSNTVGEPTYHSISVPLVPNHHAVEPEHELHSSPHDLDSEAPRGCFCIKVCAGF